MSNRNIMVSLNVKLTILCALCILGCARNADTNTPTIRSVAGLIKQAEDESNSLEKRLFFAQKADSIAARTKDKSIQLEAKRTVAGLNLLLGNLQIAQTDFTKMTELSMELSDFENTGIAYNNLAVIYDERGIYDAALQCYDHAILNFRKDNNQLQVARSMVNIGILQLNQGNYEGAFKTNIQAAEILNTLDAEDELSAVYISLGVISKRQNSFESALQYFQKAMQVAKKSNDSAGIAIVLTNIGELYYNNWQYQNALNCYMQSLDIKHRLGIDKSTGSVLDNIAEVYTLLNEDNKAKEYCKKALDVWTNNDDKEGILLTSNRLSNLYLKEDSLIKAENLATQTQRLFPQLGFFKQKLDNNLILSGIFNKEKQYDSALTYANAALILKDSISTSEMRENLARMDARFRTQETQKELLLSEEKRRNQSQFIFLLCFFLFSLFILSILLYRLYRAMKKAKVRIETLMDELNHRVKNNLQLISGMLQLQMDLTTEKDPTIVLQATRNRVQSMSSIHRMLYKKDYQGTISMSTFIVELVANLHNAYQDKAGIFLNSIKARSVHLNTNQAIPVGLIVNELVTNIYKYGKAIAEENVLEIKLNEENGNCRLSITDNCQYWNSVEARKRKTGVGLVLVEMLVHQLRGKWEVINSDNGTTHIVEFTK